MGREVPVPLTGLARSAELFRASEPITAPELSRRADRMITTIVGNLRKKKTVLAAAFDSVLGEKAGVNDEDGIRVSMGRYDYTFTRVNEPQDYGYTPGDLRTTRLEVAKLSRTGDPELRDAFVLESQYTEDEAGTRTYYYGRAEISEGFRYLKRPQEYQFKSSSDGEEALERIPEAFKALFK